MPSATETAPPKNPAPMNLDKGQNESVKESVKKWGKVVARRFTLIPAILFERQKELGLDTVDFNILLQLLSFWWRAADLPWPSKQTLADRIGVDASTVRRHITRLEQKGLIERVARIDKSRGQQSNSYCLKPLVKQLRDLAEEAKRKTNAKAGKGSG